MTTAVSRRSLRLAACAFGLSMLASCGPEDPPRFSVAPFFTASGNVTGLNGTVVVAIEGGRSDSIALSSSGRFTFGETRLETPLRFTIFKQPLGQTCKNTISSFNLAAGTADFPVDCTDNTNTVSGIVSGLGAGESMVLQLNLADNLVVGNGVFSFPKPLPEFAPWAVSIMPGSQNAYVCQVSNGVGSGPAFNLAINCTPRPATSVVGGVVGGLNGTLVLLNNANGETRTVTANGSYTFATSMAIGASYFVTVQAQPAGQTCSVTNAAGAVVLGSGGNIGVTCANGTETHAVGGTVSGLKAQIQLAISRNNTVLDVNASGPGPVSFAFPVPLQSGSKFQVGVRMQPAGQTCLIPHNVGTVAQSAVTDIAVVCVDNATDPLLGTWMAYDGEMALTFYPNGTYVAGVVDNDAGCGASRGNGVEMGAYRYNAATGSLSLISNVLDTNGSSCGVWRGGQGAINNGTVTKIGAAQASVLVIKASPTAAPVPFVPVPSVPNLAVGAFALGGGPSFMVFTDDGKYLGVNANDDPAGLSPAGIEYGCYTVGGLAPNTTLVPLTSGCAEQVDTDGAAGLSAFAGTPLVYGANALQLGFPSIGVGGVRIVPN